MAVLPGSLEPGPSDAHSPGSGSPTTSYTLSLLRGVIPVSDSSQVGMGMFCQWAHWCLTHHLLRKPHSPACWEDWDETNSTKQRRGERVHQPILNAACGSRHAFAALCDFTSLVFTLIHAKSLRLFTSFQVQIFKLLYFSPTRPSLRHQCSSNRALDSAILTLGPESKFTMFSCRSCTLHNLKSIHIVVCKNTSPWSWCNAK